MNIFDKTKDIFNVGHTIEKVFHDAVDKSAPALKQMLDSAVDIGGAAIDAASNITENAKDLTGKYIAAGQEAAKSFKENLNDTKK